MLWTENDIVGGTAITARRSETNPHFQIPFIIIRIPGAPSGSGWGICALSDGLLIGYANGKGEFGTKEQLAASLTEMGYVPVPKMIFKGPIETLPENRTGLPYLVMPYSKA